MYKLSATLALAGSLLLTPVQSLALGIGDITLNSKLGQPLSATLQLRDSDELGPQQIVARQANAEIYQKLGVERTFLSNSLVFTLQPDNSLDITTREPIKEPFLNFIVEISWPEGETYKEFKLLIDP